MQVGASAAGALHLSAPFNIAAVAGVVGGGPATLSVLARIKASAENGWPCHGRGLASACTQGAVLCRAQRLASAVCFGPMPMSCPWLLWCLQVEQANPALLFGLPLMLGPAKGQGPGGAAGALKVVHEGEMVDVTMAGLLGLLCSSLRQEVESSLGRGQRAVREGASTVVPP